MRTAVPSERSGPIGLRRGTFQGLTWFRTFGRTLCDCLGSRYPVGAHPLKRAASNWLRVSELHRLIRRMKPANALAFLPAMKLGWGIVGLRPFPPAGPHDAFRLASRPFYGLWLRDIAPRRRYDFEEWELPAPGSLPSASTHMATCESKKARLPEPRISRDMR